MATKNREPSRTSSKRTEQTAKQQPKRMNPEPREKEAASRDERLIGAERFPRRGDDEESG